MLNVDIGEQVGRGEATQLQTQQCRQLRHLRITQSPGNDPGLERGVSEAQSRAQYRRCHRTVDNARGFSHLPDSRQRMARPGRSAPEAPAIRTANR